MAMTRINPLPWMLPLLLAACSSSERPVDFAPRAPDASQVAQIIKRDTDVAAKYEPSAAAKKVIEHFQAANRMTAMRAKYSPVELEITLSNLRLAANQLLIEEGTAQGRALGVYLLDAFEKKLAELSQAARQVPGAAVALLTGAEPPQAIQKAYEEFAAYGGNFLVLAAANGLARQAGDKGIELSGQDRFFVRLAYKVYWSNIMPEGTNALDWMLDDFERDWYDIWVAERSLTAHPRRKLQAIKSLGERHKDYPVEKARGIVYFKARRYPKAAQAFELALKATPADKDLKAFLAAAKKQVR